MRSGIGWLVAATALPILGLAGTVLRLEGVPTAADPAPFSAASLERDLRILAADAMAGRRVGSPEARWAARYIATQFARSGLTPLGDADGYSQRFRSRSKVETANVLGLLEGAGPLAAETVVVGAHYDHRGAPKRVEGEDPEEPAIRNGADDNASGIAAMLACARSLPSQQPLARSVVFVAFSGHEDSVSGAHSYLDSAPRSLEETVAMLNLDRVGALGAGPLRVRGSLSAREFPELLADLRPNGLSLVFAESAGELGDDLPFRARSIPSLRLSTRDHPRLGTPEDDWDSVDVPGALRIAGYACELVRRLASASLRPSYQDLGTGP